MGHQDEDFQLFDQCKVCIVSSKDLSPDTAQQVRTELKKKKKKIDILESNRAIWNSARVYARGEWRGTGRI